MDILNGIASLLETLTHLGFPLWSGIALLVAYYVITALRRALLKLHANDLALQQIVTDHMAAMDKRTALLEQIVQQHDRAIESVWTHRD